MGSFNFRFCTFSLRTFSYFSVAYGSMYNIIYMYVRAYTCVHVLRIHVVRIYVYVSMCVVFCVSVCACVSNGLHCNVYLTHAYCVLKYHLLCAE